jgi:hypothetical protein
MMKTKALAIGAAAALSLFAVERASANTIVLTFDQLNSSVNEGPASYYAGGFGSAGTGPGPNYGITFSDNTITGCVQPNACANTNSAEAPSNPNIIFFLTGNAATMDVAGGFNTGFSFFYSSVNVPAQVVVYSGLDETGSVLATINLPVTPADGDAGCFGEPYCPYSPIGVTFDGTAMSVDFGGTENQVGFDNITLGSATAGMGGVPEPATWAMMLIGFGGLGAAMRSNRRKQAALAA